MDYSKEDFDLVVEAIWQEYKNNPIKISHPQSLLSAALPVASHNYTKEKDGVRINFDPTQIAALKAIPNKQIRSIIYSLGAQEKVLKNCSPGKTVASERSMTIPAFIPDHPLRFSLKIYDSFDNWYEAHQLKRSRQLKDFDSKHIENIYKLVKEIDQKLQLTASPQIIIPLHIKISAGNTTRHIVKKANEEYGEDILNYLEEEGVMSGYRIDSFKDFPEALIISLNIKNFLKFKAETEQIYNKLANKPQQKFPIPKTTKWEDITIKFRDGHNVNIVIDGKITPSDYKMMGFEDRKKRLPNQQWSFLQLLAKEKGTLTWQNSDANDSLKKKKQLLAETLKAYFQIDEDPFYPYKQEKAYKIKISLIPE